VTYKVLQRKKAALEDMQQNNSPMVIDTGPMGGGTTASMDGETTVLMDDETATPCQPNAADHPGPMNVDR
jgi:hypothetical protein